MRILILSYYYHPDLSAGSFRTKALIDAFKNKDANATVLTTIPNRYATYQTKVKKIERSSNIEIIRFNVPSHNSGMIDQARSFISFYFQVKAYIKDNDFDLVYATSSRLFTAFLGARIARKKDIPLYLDIRDLFIDTIKNLLNPLLFFFLKPFLHYVEHQTFNQAFHINLVSPGFKNYFNNRFKCKQYSYLTNGIDNEFIQDLPKKSINNHRKSILYAGNIGSGQGLERIIPALAVLHPELDFIIIGDGGRKIQFIKSIKFINNIKFINPVNRERLLQYYADADILFLHLNNFEAFTKVLPSKLFEYAATGKPILAGVAGYPKSFIQNHINNSAVFDPCNSLEASKALSSLNLENNDHRHDFIDKFSRHKIMNELFDSLIMIAKKNL